MANKTCVLLNPAAGRGTARKKLEGVEDLLVNAGVQGFFETTSSGDEKRQTVAALSQGFETIIVFGGDGTCSRVANVIVERSAKCRLSVIPAGTGNDVAKMLGVAAMTPVQICELAARGAEARMDVGLADGNYFLNSCGFGFDASVLEATQRVRFLRGDAVYIYSALAQLFSYRGIEVSVDGAFKPKRQKLLMVTASNGRSLGGAFRIAPTASVIDGKLDFCLFEDNNVVGRMRVFAGALRGKHLTLPGVTGVKADCVLLTFIDKPAMEVDGELLRATSRSVRIECVPKALAVVAAPGFPE
jgi:diacylglycerol kinase (ATP)